MITFEDWALIRRLAAEGVPTARIAQLPPNSRFGTGRMIPTRKSKDLLLGNWELIQQLGRVSGG